MASKGNGRYSPYPQQGKQSDKAQQKPQHSQKGTIQHISTFLNGSQRAPSPLGQPTDRRPSSQPPGTPQDIVGANTTVAPEGASTQQVADLSASNFPQLRTDTPPAASTTLQNPLPHASHLPLNTSAIADAHNTSQHASNSPLTDTASPTAHDFVVSNALGMTDGENETVGEKLRERD